VNRQQIYRVKDFKAFPSADQTETFHEF